MSAGPAILAVDLGTSGVKVALITVQGQVLGWEVQPLTLQITADGGAEQSPAEWWQAFISAAQRLLGRGLTPPGSVKAVCCSTQGEGTVPVDEAGNALMNCILWMDMRGAPYLHRQAKGLINLLGVDLFKLVRWIRLTGGMPSITGKDPAGHMLLVRDRFPEVYARTFKFLNVLDYMNLRLTGRFATTFDSILTSWVTDNRDPDGVHYAVELVRRCGVEVDKLPEIRACRVSVVIAGMEGALASVVGGLVNMPVIAVPTSVGYGASVEGISALRAMMTSCAAGVTVVNIDNGFGAGFAAFFGAAFTDGFAAAFAGFAGLPETLAPSRTAAWPAARRAIGMRNGEQLT